MREFSSEELHDFLDAVDLHLTEPARLEIVGGSSLSLAYVTTTTTIDIDTATALSPALLAAIDKARQDTGLALPVSQSGVFEAPDGYQDRLLRHETAGQFLEVWVLEKHDLTISKLLRNDEHDRQHIRALHAADPLDFETLICRFRDEMLPIVVGDVNRVRAYFLWGIEELFGELSTKRAKDMLAS